MLHNMYIFKYVPLYLLILHNSRSGVSVMHKLRILVIDEKSKK
jgi:hypothetical protein